MTADERFPGAQWAALRGGFARLPRLVRVLVLIACAWLLPLVTHALGIDVVLPVAMLLAVASLLRAGGTLLDRLMLAGGLLLGCLLCAGLLFSLWPWGLAPVPVAGTMLTGVVLAAAAIGRGPSLPRRVLGSDVLVLGSGVAAWLVVAWPTLGARFADQLAFFPVNRTGDRLRHYSMFDAIHHIGGYTFLDVSAAEPYLSPGFAEQYPNGTGYLYALADVFVRSTTDPGAANGEFRRYYWYTVAGYALLVLAVVWAARWVAGPMLAGWRRAFILAAVGAFLATGIMLSLFWQGFDSEVLGLLMLVLGTAALVRYPDRPGEQTLVVAASAVGVAFTYPLYLASLGIGALIVLALNRRRFRPAWRRVSVVAGVGTAVALVAVAAPHLAGSLDESDHLLVDGVILPFPRTVILAFGALLLVAYGLRRVRRSPALCAMGGQLVAGAAVVVGIALYQWATVGKTSYYLEKVVHAWVLLVLVGAGAVGLLLRGEALHAAVGGGVRARARRVGTAVVAAGAAVLVAGGISWGSPVFVWGRPGADTTWGTLWAKGMIISSDGREMRSMYHAGMLGDGVPTLVVASPGGWDNAITSMQVAVMNHQFRALQDLVAGMPKIGAPEFDPKSGADPLNAVTLRWTDNLAAFIPHTGEAFRVVVFDAAEARRLQAAVDATPGSRVEIVLLSPSGGRVPIDTLAADAGHAAG
ncbi:hypothetical protein LO772_23155 [Yinghuangia sp. ASG 101]|uniref:hypothetical protein n=1 Tax=Yinghuangia sp. ASG 101 TaxID=2896848 RepID=UPI001E55185A|nr:hypothetical protein [Yinghuangia sp. ASG 101]UGQ09790.1 hypothetical protein LO772_23155 [Yinghuangia sp. ASG 101]